MANLQISTCPSPTNNDFGWPPVSSSEHLRMSSSIMLDGWIMCGSPFGTKPAGHNIVYGPMKMLKIFLELQTVHK